MSQYKHHVFVCSLGKTCAKEGGVETFQAIKRAARKADLQGLVRINKAGCMNQCGHGPMVVVYPDDIWYHQVDEKGGQRIVAEHLVSGFVVEDYRYIAPPGDNKLVDDD